MLYVGLRRATDPTDMGRWHCGVCDVPFDVDAVQVQTYTRDCQMEPVCPACIEHLGRRNAAQFPTIEEYREALKLYPEPIFDYEPEDYFWQPAYHASWIDREDFRLTEETNA